MALHSLLNEWRKMLVVAVTAALLQGCAATPWAEAEQNAADAGLKRQEITAGSFRIATYSRIRDTNQPINIYIDGDVRGWTPSADPGIDNTPDETIGLQLAALDPATNVVFIAHPCQFGIDDPVCFDESWTNGRYAHQVLASINRAIDHIVVSVPHPHLNLVGYSGGGAIAAVIAARRYDVLSLRTIAGNLDPDGTDRSHAADPQNDFIDPMEIAPRLASMPQEHFVGDHDGFVPPFLTGNFVKAVGPSPCLKVTHIPEASHLTGWEEAWENNVTRLPYCLDPQRTRP